MIYDLKMWQERK